MRSLLTIVFVLAQWVSLASGNAILEGHWTSCRFDTGEWSERIYEHRTAQGVFDWELHFGPQNEFALYKSPGPDGPNHSHEGPQNKLGPAFRIGDVQTWRGKRNWTIPELKLHLSIAEGNKENDCEGYFVLIRSTT